MIQCDDVRRFFRWIVALVYGSLGVGDVYEVGLDNCMEGDG